MEEGSEEILQNAPERDEEIIFIYIQVERMNEKSQYMSHKSTRRRLVEALLFLLWANNLISFDSVSLIVLRLVIGPCLRIK